MPRHKEQAQQKESTGGDRPLTSYLRAVDIFRDLTEEEIASIHSIIPMSRRPRGTVFYRPGESGERLFILKEGSVILYRLSPDGHKLVLGKIRGGAIFGEMVTAGRSMQNCFAEAEENALVCSMTRTDMERLLREHPDVALRLLASMGQRVQELEERLEQMAYSSARQRVAKFLLENRQNVSGSWEVKGFTHESLGEAIGASRPTVTQELRRMEDEGLVGIDRRRVRLLSVASLNSVVDAG